MRRHAHRTLVDPRRPFYVKIRQLHPPHRPYHLRRNQDEGSMRPKIGTPRLLNGLSPGFTPDPGGTKSKASSRRNQMRKYSMLLVAAAALSAAPAMANDTGGLISM